VICLLLTLVGSGTVICLLLTLVGSGLLCRYNTKVKYGRGFTLEELKQAGINRKEAPLIGIAVDHRRSNKSVESLQINVQRLKEYKGKLVILKKDAAQEPVAQLISEHVLPFARPDRRVKARAITADEKKADVYREMRIARADARMVGVRQRKADEAAAEAALKKK
jgi:large subunit ribosomal protein L13e